MRRGSVALLSAGALGVVLGGCSARQERPPRDLKLPPRDPSLGQRLAVQPCDQDGARVELVGARRDPEAHKPSIDIDDYLVDLRARSHAETWLILDRETWAFDVDEVRKDAEGSGWWLGLLRAYLIPQGGDLTLKDLQMGIDKDGKLSAILARIRVDHTTPQRWLEGGGESARRFAEAGKPVPLVIDVQCLSWFDVHAPAHTASP